MKRKLVRLFFVGSLVFDLSACSTMDPRDAAIVQKANEYLRTGVTRDPDEAVRLAREFYRASALQNLEASQRATAMKADVDKLETQRRQLDSWSASNAPR